MKSYFQIGADEQLAVLQYGSRQLQMPENILEKDIWLCWVLEQIFKMPSAPKMAFKGGTSLSKVFGLIERFSEDVDITLDYRNFEDFKLFDPNYLAMLSAGMFYAKTLTFEEICDTTLLIQNKINKQLISSAS